jgi:anti-sigma B factor antagonist
MMHGLSGSGLRVEPQQQQAAAVLSVAGDVDAANAHVLRDAVVAAIDDGSPVVVVDLAQVGYVDSVGLGTLVQCLKRASERGTTMRLVVASPQIEKILSITGLQSVFEVFHDQQSAVADRGRADRGLQNAG